MGRTKSKSWRLIMLTVSVAGIPAGGAVLEVPGSATIYGAGLDTAPGGGTAPPVWAFTASAGQILQVKSVTGTVSSGVGFGPDCEGSITYGTSMDSYLGISGILADRAFFLAGVFLAGTAPTRGAPPALDFREGAIGRDFASLAPEIGRTSYIGDGREGDGGREWARASF